MPRDWSELAPSVQRFQCQPLQAWNHSKVLEEVDLLVPGEPEWRFATKTGHAKRSKKSGASASRSRSAPLQTDPLAGYLLGIGLPKRLCCVALCCKSVMRLWHLAPQGLTAIGSEGMQGYRVIFHVA